MKRVLIYDPERHLMDALPSGAISIQSTERIFKEEVGIEDIEVSLVREFEPFQEMSRKPFDLIITDAKDDLKVAQLVKKIKSANPSTIVLVEECEGYEDEILEAGADNVFYWWGESKDNELGLLDLVKAIVKDQEDQVEIEEAKMVGDKEMNILVVDDNPLHQVSAVKTLAGHNVIVARNFHEAKNLLVVKPDHEKARKMSRDEGIEYAEAVKRSTPELPKFDVVLSDLLMPKGSSETMGPKGQQFLRQEMGFGYVIAVLAAKAGVPIIAVVTDTGHHDHPMAYTFDMLNGHGQEFNPEADITINSSKVMFRFCPGFTKEGGKNWGLMLAIILEDRDAMQFFRKERVASDF